MESGQHFIVYSWRKNYMGLMIFYGTQ